MPKRCCWRPEGRNDEGVTLPLDQLIAIAQRDLAKNKVAFRETAARIAPGKDPRAVLLSVSSALRAPTSCWPPRSRCSTRSASSSSTRTWSRSRRRRRRASRNRRRSCARHVGIDGHARSIRTGGERGVLQHHAARSELSKARVDEFMRAWYPEQIANVSVHEVYPGHYTQFLYGPQFPSRIRKVFGASSNSEGWAHYCEQMMLDEGLANGDPKARLAQLQDALLRNVRFIAGIQLHTGR